MPHRRGSRKPSRDLEIIKLLDHSNPPLTLEEVGQRFNITRERTRQVYKRATGKNYKRRIKHNQEKAEKRAEAKSHEVIFHCEACLRAVERHERGFKYCPECRDVFRQNRDPRLILSCQRCNKQFHPNRFFENTNKDAKYCSYECFKADGVVGRRKDPEVAKRNAAIREEYLASDKKRGTIKGLAEKYKLNAANVTVILREVRRKS